VWSEEWLTRSIESASLKDHPNRNAGERAEERGPDREIPLHRDRAQRGDPRPAAEEARERHDHERADEVSPPVERALLLFERGASLVLGSGSGSLAGDGRRRVQGPSLSPPAASRHERRLTRVVAANVRHGEEIVAAAKRVDAMLARKPNLADRLA